MPSELKSAIFAPISPDMLVEALAPWMLVKFVEAEGDSVTNYTPLELVWAPTYDGVNQTEDWVHYVSDPNMNAHYFIAVGPQCVALDAHLRKTLFAQSPAELADLLARPECDAATRHAAISALALVCDGHDDAIATQVVRALDPAAENARITLAAIHTAEMLGWPEFVAPMEALAAHATELLIQVRAAQSIETKARWLR